MIVVVHGVLQHLTACSLSESVSHEASSVLRGYLTMTYENTSGYMRDSKRRKFSLVVFMALGDIGLVPLLLMHTQTGDTRLYLSAEYAESHIGFQAILLQTIVNVATYIG